MITASAVGRRLAQAMHRAGYPSAYALAKGLGRTDYPISSTVLHRYLAGEQLPGLKNATILCHHLKVSLDSLVTD